MMADKDKRVAEEEEEEILIAAFSEEREAFYKENPNISNTDSSLNGLLTYLEHKRHVLWTSFQSSIQSYHAQAAPPSPKPDWTETLMSQSKACADFATKVLSFDKKFTELGRLCPENTQLHVFIGALDEVLHTPSGAWVIPQIEPRGSSDPAIKKGFGT